MTIKHDIAEERIRIGKAVQKSKFGQHIVDTVINPILNAVDKDILDTANWIGAFVVMALRENILQSTPSGSEYTVVLVENNGDKNKYTEMGTYVASAAGQPPASFDSGLGVPTGTLFDSISFEIDEKGKVRVGVFDSVGTEYQSLFFAGGKIFITKNKGKKTPVEVYANALDVGADYGGGVSVEERPWFRKVLNEIRPQIRQKIRENLHKSLQSRSKIAAKDKIMYFRVYFDNKKALDNSPRISSGIERIIGDID